VVFAEMLPKPLVVEFTNPAQTSDGGALLLRAKDDQMMLTERMAEAIVDQRQEGKVRHSVREMLRERSYGLACGYPDGNDARRLGLDPLLRLVCRGGMSGEPGLASQPTLSRLENTVRRADLLRMGYAITDAVLETEQKRRWGKRVRQITVDMDPTEDPTYGGQQLTFFNSFYDNYCYLPMVTTLKFDEETDEVMVAPVLRPGNAPGKRGALVILKRLLPKLRQRFAFAELRVRMDGAFATPEIFDYLEREKLGYAINMAKNKALQRMAAPLLARARRRAKRTGQTARVYGSFRYQAGKWPKPRRVVIKAEVTMLPDREPRDNPRFVVTSLPGTAREVYGWYGGRGSMENRIKELDSVGFGLTSCTSFQANQFRNLLSAAAFILYQQLRRDIPDPQERRSQVWTLRERLVKIGMTVRESVRRILLEGPAAYPWQNIWRLLAFRLGAIP
jgi:hypothetical protein